MSARIIDGKAFAARLAARVAAEAARLKSAHGITPGIAVVLVGDDPASAVYVAAKSRAVHEAGLSAFDHRYPASLSESGLIARVESLNADSSVHGILVQMPLPAGIDANRVIDAIDPLKDVDGLTAANAGRLSRGESGPRSGLVACTPLGALMLIEDACGGKIAGKHALVLGRSNLVGKPMAQLLLAANATVTVAHSHTRDAADLARRADILIAAVGKPEMVRGDWIKPGAVVIDVGTNRKVLADGSRRLVGDVAYDEALPIAGAITPVPGGVGPMTIACLMRNTLVAASLQAGLKQPELSVN
jgi:methylenetetrahydrofolate dehydrogenase (NADP+) / methenyltetrahydrofolate cyclohydrolase